MKTPYPRLRLYEVEKVGITVGLPLKDGFVLVLAEGRDLCCIVKDYSGCVEDEMKLTRKQVDWFLKRIQSALEEAEGFNTMFDGLAELLKGRDQRIKVNGLPMIADLGWRDVDKDVEAGVTLREIRVILQWRQDRQLAAIDKDNDPQFVMTTFVRRDQSGG